MKISEMIDHLLYEKEQHGDLPVTLNKDKPETKIHFRTILDEKLIIQEYKG